MIKLSTVMLSVLLALTTLGMFVFASEEHRLHQELTRLKVKVKVLEQQGIDEGRLLPFIRPKKTNRGG